MAEHTDETKMDGAAQSSRFYILWRATWEKDLKRLFDYLSRDGFWNFGQTSGVWRYFDRDEGTNGQFFLHSLVKQVFERIEQPPGDEDDKVDKNDQGDKDCITLVLEAGHVDAVFRDLYYSVFSRAHRKVRRDSFRLTLFQGMLDERAWGDMRRRLIERGSVEHRSFFEQYPRDVDDLQERFIGSCVLNPLSRGSIGRTLINPRYLVRTAKGLRSSYAAIRTSNFKITLMGRPLTVRTFPYRMQDGFSIRCAETTLINLTEYYSNEYNEYSMLVGSKIHALESRYVSERTVPARGISYHVASRILASERFYPRLYGTDQTLSGDKRLKRALFHYIESGIPVAVNVAETDGTLGHSIICAGHGSFDKRLFAQAKQSGLVIRGHCGEGITMDRSAPLSERLSWAESMLATGGANAGDAAAARLNVVFASDLCDQFVVVDDNHLPFQLRSYDDLSLHSTMRNANMLVALHQSMMLDAWDMENALMHALEEKKGGLFAWAGDYLDRVTKSGTPGAADVVLRLYMASSRRFKTQRVQTLDEFRSCVYEIIPMPHFIWVAELYTRQQFLDSAFTGDSDRWPVAFAEIVFDATAGPYDDSDSGIIIGNYPTRMYVSLSDEGGMTVSSESFDGVERGIELCEQKRLITVPKKYWFNPDDSSQGIPAFSENLTRYG